LFKKKIISCVFFILILKISVFPNSTLKDIRYFSYEDYTRIVLDLSEPIKYIPKELKEERRVRFYFDLLETDVSKELLNEKRITFDNSYIKEIRIGQFRKDIARVVLEFEEAREKNYFQLYNPFRIVIDVYKEERSDSFDSSLKYSPDIQDDKKYSMARQLSLKVNKIVIDAGHGGKDPGAIGKYYKTQEKDIVLDIAKKLEYYFKKYTDLTVYMTRDDDSYLSLEERTAFANSKKSDLFISIHANSAKNREVFGLETFWLNFTTDPHAISIAASENASSKKKMGELKELLKKISLTSKIIESRILARKVHYATLSYLQKDYKYPDYKTRKAPFYVLIGATMPSILIETGFISNKNNEKLLRSDIFKNKLAYGIYLGVLDYIDSLKGD